MGIHAKKVGFYVIEIFVCNVFENLPEERINNLEYHNSEYHNLDIDRNHARNVMANIFFKNRSYLYSPCLEREPKKKILKINAD